MEEVFDLQGTTIRLASEIVAAYVSHNPVPANEVAPLVVSVHSAVAGLMDVQSLPAPGETFGKPTADEIRISIQIDGIVSFIDGRPYKTLKRHLTAHGLDPQSYRERFGLPDDYPMVAASYAARRSVLAKQLAQVRYGPSAGATPSDNGPASVLENQKDAAAQEVEAGRPIEP